MSSIRMNEAKHDIRVRDHEYGEPGVGVRRLRSARSAIPDTGLSIPLRIVTRCGSGGNADPGLFLECVSKSRLVSGRVQHQHLVDADSRQSGTQSNAQPAFSILEEGA